MFPITSLNSTGTVNTNSFGIFGNTMQNTATETSVFNPQMGVAIDTFGMQLFNNQMQLQNYFFAILQNVLQNPAIDHSIPIDIQKNFRPYDYNKYGESGDKIAKLNPKMQEKTMQLIDYAKSQGLEIIITSGYRTEAEQAELRRTKPNLAAKNSRHCKGKAIDIRVIKNGKKASDAEYKKLGEYAKSIGMRWGGDFVHPQPEQWHFDID